MKKGSTPIFPLVSLCMLIYACGNNATDPEPAKQANPQVSTGWNVGVALYSFNPFAFSVGLQKADSAGLKFVEGFSFHKLGGEFKDSTMANISSGGINRMKQLLDEKGMTMKSMYVSDAKNAQEWKRYFEMAKTFGMEFLVCEPDPAHWNILDSLGEIYNIKTAIHQHAKGSSRYWHPDSVLAAINGHKNIGACADLGHWVRSGLDPVKCLNQLKGHILSIHLKDIAKTTDGKGEDVTVGKGTINFDGVVRELKNQNFAGLVYVECEHNIDNNVPDVKAAVQHFNSLSQ
ncbi:MAG TPA: sugar phosphate isomerase/epimerase family protein [Chitinophagaceae bacterium]|nr:sugar phosphate isomerase/epimerase family protein [Chitinophagaceae bacterium]